MKKWPSLKYCCFSRRKVYPFGSRRRTCCRRQNYAPMIRVLVVSYWAQRRAKKGYIRSSGFLRYLHQLFTTTWYQIRSLVGKPLIYFQVVSFMLPKRHARVLDDAFVRVLASPNPNVCIAQPNLNEPSQAPYRFSVIICHWCRHL